MDTSIRRGSWEMVGAMLISGTIGWFVLVSGVPVIEVVFWRCVIGGLTLLLVCWRGAPRTGPGRGSVCVDRCRMGRHRSR